MNNAVGAGEEVIAGAGAAVPTELGLTVNLAAGTGTFTAALAAPKYDVLYVSESRDAINGYTSNAAAVETTIPEKPGSSSVIDAVPQTSKELIKFNTTTNELKIEFTGAIDPDTLKNPDNYKLNGKLLSAYGMTSADIKYVVDNKGTLLDVTDDQRYAVFTVPTNSVVADGDVAIEVMNVANPDGGKMTPVVTKIFLLDNTEPLVIASNIEGQRQIKLSFDEPVEFKAGADKIAAAKNFKIMAGDVQLTVLEATVSGTNSVTLNLGSDIPATGSLTVEIVEDQNGSVLIQDTSSNKNPLAQEIYTVR